MKLANQIYQWALPVDGGIRSRVCSRLRRLWLKVGDPDCEMEVHGQRLSMPFSHLLPWHRVTHPCYDTLLERLSAWIRERDGELRAIDVGANIGDTIAALHLEADDAVLAIEPAPGFVRFLRENWGADQRVMITEAICSSHEVESGFVIEENDGTARLREANGESGSPEVLPLDRMLERSPRFSEPNLLKVDTDGHDFEVLAGSSEVIERARPAVFFECDAFENPDYLDHCREALERFRQAGYAGMLVYDNFGYLMGRHSLDQLEAFEQLLAYQVISEFYYFDLLLIEDQDELDAFYQAELLFFSQRIGEADLPEKLVRQVSRDPRSSPETSVELAG